MEKTLQLHPKQGQAFRSRATEILYGGAAGGGKSHLFRVAAIAWSYAIPGLQTYIFRRTFDDLYKNHMEGPSGFPVLLADWVNQRLCSINHSTHSISFWNGSKIFLNHCQYEKDVTKYQGAEIHVLMMDELTQFTAKIYRFLRGRVRLGGLKVPEEYRGLFPRILNGSNPGGIGHNWVKQDFVDFSPEAEIRKADKSEGGMRRQFIRSLLEDNPTLLENDPDYEDRLEGLGDPALVRAMRRGDWDIVAGGMFDDVWRRDRHVISPFEIPESWSVDRSFDWGSSKPFSVGWWAESDGTTAPNGRTYPRGTLFRFAELYGWNGKPNEGCKWTAKEIAEEVKIREAEMTYAVKEGEEKKKLIVNPGPADDSIWDEENNNCIARDMAKHGIIWTKAGKTPGTRKTGWEKMRGMLRAAAQFPMEDPGLFVFNHCTHFIRTVPVLPRDTIKTDDVDTDAEDHCGDEARYRILKVNAGRAY